MTKRISSRRKRFCNVRISNGNVFSSAMARLRLHLLGLGPGFLDGADHVKRLLRQIIMLSFQDLPETADGLGHADILAFKSSKLLGYEEWLRQEALNLAGARDGEFVLFAQFLHTQDCDDVL